ncbi:MAG: AraC family transcriptional regulator [Tissierellaceae bacterium]
MKNTIHISNVMKKFNLLTNISIIAFDPSGISLGASGYDRDLYNFFEKNKIYDRITENFFTKNEDILTSPCCENIRYILSPVCQRNIHRGIFIIGPLCAKKNTCMRAPYKPEEIYPYILETLRFLWHDFPNKHISLEGEKEYSLHIKKAIDYMDSRYMDDIGLGHVAEYLNINSSYLSTMFKRETKNSFTNFLNKIRVEKSKFLLVNQDYSMLDISLMVGFNSQNYYNIIFKKITGYTPLEYRKKYSYKNLTI